MSAVYFGGSRKLPGQLASITRVVHHAVRAGHSVHVGCQFGADQAVITAMSHFPSSLVVFAVAPSPAQAPAHVQQASRRSQVVFSAGGSSAPMRARFLLRSIAAFQGCSQAVFFQPGPGSLAVARECVARGLQVFAFQAEPPAPVPSQSGSWVASQFLGFSCWQWQPAASQPSFF